jgi:hypothetical protein
MERTLVQLKPKLVVFDTLSAAVPGADENAAQDMGPIIGFFNRLAASTGAAVLAIHHASKGDEKTARGSGTIEANADGVIRLAKEKSDTISVLAKKVRASAPAEPLRLRLETVMLGEDPERPGRLVGDAVLVRATIDAPPSLEALLSDLIRVRGGCVSRPAAVEHLCEHLKWKPTKAETAITEAIPQGRANADPMWGLWREADSRGRWSIHRESSP